jgi:hypothetical protein
VFNLVCLKLLRQLVLFQFLIAPIKANLPRGRDAKPRVFFLRPPGLSRAEDSLVAEGDLEASFLILLKHG